MSRSSTRLWTVLTPCTLFVAVTVCVLGTQRRGAAEIDYRGVAQKLVARHAASMTGQVRYRVYDCVTAPGDFDELHQIVSASHRHEVGRLKLSTGVAEWLAPRLRGEHAAWSGTCAFMAEGWVDRKQRIHPVGGQGSRQVVSRDGVRSVAPPQDVVVYSDWQTQTTIEDWRVVLVRNASSGIHPMMRMDVTLGPWEQAVPGSVVVEGQEIHATEDQELASIVYVNTMADSWHTTRYSFARSLDWGPTFVDSYDADGFTQRLVFGYGADAISAISRPVVAVRGVRRLDQSVRITLWMIDEWRDECDLDTIRLRKPPVHLEVDWTADTSGPIATFRDLEDVGVSPCLRFPAAIARIASSWGSNDEGADFDGDGIVTGADVTAAFQLYNPKESGHGAR
jgi:hypothetical protein